MSTLKASWKDACEGMEFALNFLKSNAGIESPVLLSSPFVLITLANYGKKLSYELTPMQADRLRFWTLVANAKGRYSRGSSETILDQDLVTVTRGGGADELVDRLRLQVGRLDIAPEELEGRNQRSALFKTMFLAFRQAGAKDWRSHLAISLDTLGVSIDSSFITSSRRPRSNSVQQTVKPTTLPILPSSEEGPTGKSATKRLRSIFHL